MTNDSPPVPSPPPDKTRLHLIFLDGLRGLAALQVVFFHFVGLSAGTFPKWVNIATSWTRYGHFAVNVFIVLSGFTLMLPVARAADGKLRGGAKDYLGRRARRILPPYYASLLISIVVVAILSQIAPHVLDYQSKPWVANLTAGNIISHLFLVHNLNPAWNDSPLNMALWSVATEWQIYFVFPALLLPIWRRFGNGVVIVAGFVIGLLPYFLLRHYVTIDQACPWYIGLFAIGMMGAVLSNFKHWQQQVWAKSLLWLALVCALLYVGSKFLQPSAAQTASTNIQWIKDTLAGATAWCLIMYCMRFLTAEDAALAAPRPLLLRVLELPWLVKLGVFSYSIYLMHCPVLNVLEAVVGLLHLPALAALAFKAVVGIPLAIAIAYGFHIVVERPFLPGAWNKNVPVKL